MNRNRNRDQQDDGSRIGLAVIVGIAAFIVGGALGLDGVWWVLQKLIPALVVCSVLGLFLRFQRRRNRR
ncbi:hypothetical protein AB0958_44955 [Streptomyces sp. NPDC006655]|uniref:hypothetical protein n=1 Tax=Streptomyces sp. NPDC006655 TaxID=3156898 RepID=UPI0034541148